MSKTNESAHIIDEIAQQIASSKEMPEQDKKLALQNLQKLKQQKINILITGATGCGKSSTINALFGANIATVGQGSDPETMEIQKYNLENLILWDSPGLGDGKEADRKHAKNIIDKLAEKDQNGNMLIDLVLVILDGCSRDLGTPYELINNVIIPNLGEDKSRLLVAINKADVAMNVTKHWDEKNVKPKPELQKFLEDKVASTKKRIKEATGIDIDVIYYSAGYKDGDEEQQPYNLNKLLLFILLHTKKEKRALFTQNINRDKKMWEKDDELEDYNKKIQSTLWESVVSTATAGAKIGAKIGAVFGKTGELIGTTLGAAGGAVVGFFKGLFD